MTGAADKPNTCRDCGEELELRRPCRMFRKGGVIVGAICAACAKRQDERKTLEATVWSRTHKDYRGQLEDGRRSIMLPASMGGGLAPLDSLTVEQLRELCPPKKGSTT